MCLCLGRWGVRDKGQYDDELKVKGQRSHGRKKWKEVAEVHCNQSCFLTMFSI